MINRFNIRVYGVCRNEQGDILIADERIKGLQITKFPGGGLEFGEGTLECVKREFVEETGQEVAVIGHFYTTDFFVASVFNPSSQVLCIYYEVRLLESPRFTTQQKSFDFPEGTADVLRFRWIPHTEISPELFTFPTDQRVAELIQKERS
ncbi:MAG TPA: NUDIX domain-containing protein [Bacteroidia bacterium]|jgi:8-oxo-dGTP diphosphatase|nr:NUDIX domain-containing protein [Bacteroidia bacterium]